MIIDDHDLRETLCTLTTPKYVIPRLAGGNNAKIQPKKRTIINTHITIINTTSTVSYVPPDIKPRCYFDFDDQNRS